MTMKVATHNCNHGRSWLSDIENLYLIAKYKKKH